MGRVVRLSSSFTRPSNTTDYTANDLVANSATANSVSPISIGVGKRGFKIWEIKLVKTDQTDVSNADFDVNLWTTSPTTTAGDNEAWTIAASPIAGYMGEWDLPTMVAGTDDAYTVLRVGDTGMTQPIAGYADNGYIYALLQADGAYSPASGEVFTLFLTVEYV